MLRFTTIAAVVALFLAAPAFADPPKKLDPKSAEENIRKAQGALAPADTTLKWLSRTAWLEVVLKGTPEWRAVDTFLSNSSKTASDLKKGTDKLVELADKKMDQPAVEKEAKSLLDKIKLVRPEKQVEELEHLAGKVRDLPVGLVSEQIDDKFKVSADLLVKDPKEAQARFKAYLGAMQANTKFLTENQKALEEAAQNARAAGQIVRKLQEGIEKAAPAAGPHNKAFVELYLDFDKLAKAYNGLASNAAAKAKDVMKAAEMEQRRHANLKATIKTVFGFDS